MTTLTEASSFDAVYQLETTDPVTGGPGGVANRQAQQLANRTKYLLDKFGSPLALPDGSTAATPPQFDADVSVATTAFVQRALGNKQGLIGTGGSYTIAPSDMGKTIYVSGIGGAALTLPAANAVPAGSSISVINLNTGGVTIGRPTSGAGSTDVIQYGVGSASSSAINQGEYLELISDGSGQWFPGARTSGFGLLPVFGAVKAVNGYQKLPGGYIEQWGSTGAGPDSTGALVPFPIAFPNACLNITASDSGLVCASMGILPASTSTFRVWGRDFNGSYNNYSVQWRAIGY